MERIQALRLAFVGWFIGEVLPARFFYLGTFVSNDKPVADYYQLVEITAKSIVEGHPECGTSACVLGWCPYVFPENWVFMRGSLTPRFIYREDGYEQEVGVVAANGFFGLDDKEADFLFYANPTRSNVVELHEIKTVLKNHGFDYDGLLPEARAMFGEDLAERFQPVCPAEQASVADNPTNG